jgi:hypothetical protein
VKESNMTLAIDRQHSATQLEDMRNRDPATGKRLPPFDFEDYLSGTRVARPGDIQTGYLNVLVEGTIKVKVECSLGESTLHVFNPGDVLRLETIADIPMSDMGSLSNIRTTFLAEGNIRIVRLKPGEIEGILRSESALTYRIIEDMLRKWHEAVANIHAQCDEIRRYIYSRPALEVTQPGPDAI